MSEVEISYKGSPIASMNASGSKKLKTQGKYCEGDIDVTYSRPSPALQDKSVSITPSESAQSQTVTPDSGKDGLSSVAVAVGAVSSSYVGSGITRRSSSDLTASGASVTAPAGYYASAASKSVASGSAGTPTASKGTVSNHSVAVTPSVTNSAGYISGGTKTGTAVTVSASELVSGSETKTENGTYDVTNLEELVVNVSGGGGSSKNFQVDNTNHRISGTTYVETGAEITVAAAGKYNIYWSAFRSSTSTGTNGTQCYVNGNTQGSAFTTWSNSYAQSPKLSGVTLAKNDVIKIYARASSSSRYVCVANLTIEQID